MQSHEIFEEVAVAFEFVGVFAMAVGFIVAVAISLRTWHRTGSGRRAFGALRQSFGAVILLGLEVLVAADLVRTVTSAPSLTDALVLAIVVLIRTILSFSLQVEIDGVAPWRRALVTGPEALLREAKASNSKN